MAGRRVGILVFDGVKLLDVAGPSEVFSEANRFGGDYEVTLYSADGSGVASSTGMRIGEACGLAWGAVDLDTGTVDVRWTDAVIIGCGQAIEHYEMARYGLLKTWANQLGLPDAAKLLDATLQEEKKADALLSQIAEKSVNAGAKSGKSKAA